MLYFDHCASTPPREDVIRTMMEVMAKHYANPSSLHQGGVEAGKLLERSRAVVAAAFGTSQAEWTFTSGGTESNNAAIIGATARYRNKGKHLITTQIEHPSVYDTFRRLSNEGFRVTYLPVNEQGTVAAQDVAAALTEDTVMVSVMHVNNEVGSIQPIAEIGAMLNKHRKVLFHVDGIQSVGKLPIALREWGIDLFSASAHKVGGPRGVGLLYTRHGVQLEPLLAGGGQEQGLRPGTENVAAIVASAKAFRLALETREARSARMFGLRRRLVRCIGEIPELVLNGAAVSDEELSMTAVMAPHIVNFSYPGMKPEVLIHTLEENGILASTKSACSSKEDKPSQVLLAMGLGKERASSGIRISFGDEHGEADVDYLCGKLNEVVARLKPFERKE
ncbi:cysteine desulfurase family protein [Paenibacillus mendelii]|uniref:Cysteine desulfurase family protein n=1 Tax=Paenibacillus mendelii TaxID=206163 RepID=A0ABV6JHZ0_9BACL|nr:cysteine desulfurase family protein [Paenibacillus mendelii]